MLNKVLLVDDDEISLMICEIVLIKEEFAHEVIKQKDGQEGLDYFERLKAAGKEGSTEKAPELILLDLNMPFINGWEFAEEFFKHYAESFPDTKICILTSSVDPMDITRTKIFDNVIGFINKPLTDERLDELKANEHITPYFSGS